VTELALDLVPRSDGCAQPFERGGHASVGRGEELPPTIGMFARGRQMKTTPHTEAPTQQAGRSGREVNYTLNTTGRGPWAERPAASSEPFAAIATVSVAGRRSSRAVQVPYTREPADGV
jgi:hypothetical protein